MCPRSGAAVSDAAAAPMGSAAALVGSGSPRNPTPELALLEKVDLL